MTMCDIPYKSHLDGLQLFNNSESIIPMVSTWDHSIIQTSKENTLYSKNIILNDWHDT